MLTASLFTLVKEKAGKASAERVGVGGRVAFGSEASKKTSSPPTQSSLPVCSGVHFSLVSLRAFNDWLEIGMWPVLTFYLILNIPRLLIRPESNRRKLAMSESSLRIDNSTVSDQQNSCFRLILILNIPF